MFTFHLCIRQVSSSRLCSIFLVRSQVKILNRKMRLKGTFLTALPFVVFLILCITRILDQTTKDLNKTTPSVQIEYFSLPPVRHATKSLADLGPMDELSGHILFFNRIPKSGSEMLLLLIQWLQGWNNFRHVRLKDDGKPKINRSEQVSLIGT